MQMVTNFKIYPFTKNFYASKDYTYSNSSRLVKNESIVVVPGDKDSCVIEMDKSDYQRKMHDMIKDGITKGVYEI